MSATPTQLTHTAHGTPPVVDCDPVEHDGHCYVCCGNVVRGRPVTKWLSTNFTDQNRVRAPLATHVCEACCYVMSRTSPVLGRPPKDGKKFGGNFRNYSHLYAADWDGAPFGEDGKPGEYANASKGEKPLIRAFLERQHTGYWFAAIADSGQKHVLPFAPVNYGPSGVVLFEEQLVLLPESLGLVKLMADLLTAGATKDEIERGDYRVNTWKALATQVHAFESEAHTERGSGWFSLAIWLAQRDEEKVAARKAAEQETRGRKGKTKAGDGNRGDAAGAEKRVSASAGRTAAVELLGADSKQDAQRSSANNDSKRVVQHDAATAADRQSTQQRLPGFG